VRLQTKSLSGSVLCLVWDRATLVRTESWLYVNSTYFSCHPPGLLYRLCCLRLLHAASRDDCSPQTLRDLGDAAAKSEEDWIQALPVFLKHLSFPLHPLPDPEDKTSEHPLDTLAALALSPIIRVIRILNNANVGLTSRLERNAPDIWRWLSRWTHAALLIEGSFASSRMPILERVVTGIHGLTLHRNLIVPEAVDVVLSHFCLAGRTKRLPIIQGIRDNIGVVSSATNQATGPEQNTAVEHLALVVQSSLYPSATFRAAENTIRAAWAQRGEEILDHACMHLDLCRSEPEGTLRMDALHDARSLVLIVTEIIDNDPAKLSVFPDYLLRRVLASTLRVYNAAISLAGTQPEAQSDGAVARLCSICCQILLAVISGQQSLLRSSTLLSWALRKGMLPALIQTPRQGAGDAFEMEIAAESGTRKIDMVEYVLHFVVLRRMWDFSVYRAAKKNLGAASSPHIDHLIQRWASAYSAMNRNVKYVKPNCYYSSVSLACPALSQ
jgi:hypothetical protein